MKRPKYKIIKVKELERVVKELFKNHEEIQLAYLYGSYAKGVQTEFSDIDIGIIIKKDFKETPLYFAKLSLDIEKHFNYKINVDLRILNNAKPRFLFQIIKSSKVLFVRDKTFLYEFELKVLYQYQDIKPMLDMYDKISIMEILSDEYRS
ncbi:MAG: type VII toxin-antitoxin system MntA family adenylyltransferase antitoxin [Promethearchaeota archaeon]